MHSFFKTLGTGVLYTLLLPFIVLIWLGYGIYCVAIFIYMFFKSIIVWIKGGTPFGDLPEEVEAKRILINKQEQQNMVNQAILNMYQNQTPQSNGAMNNASNSLPPQEFSSDYNEEQNAENLDKDDDEVSW